jgi:nucleoside-diphosphate-sugar epimerase
MNSNCIIFGGSGFIGTKLVEQLIKERRFKKIYIADLKESIFKDHETVEMIFVDVRTPISPTLVSDSVEWIFNLAAICLEPGFESHEYFETNILGAENVCSFAGKIGCANLFFTSSMALYGPTLKPMSEEDLPMPDTPYGISKLAAEYVHRVWVEKSAERRLISVRPAVIYGPGDSGNILRMIQAVKKGYFILPVTPRIKKSYGYIYGLIESIIFCMSQKDKVIIYNYAENNTENIGSMITIISGLLGASAKIIQVPFWILSFASSVLYKINPNLNGIHPMRVKKVARPTHIIPKVLLGKGFIFKYDLRNSLIHWKTISPNDF